MNDVSMIKNSQKSIGYGLEQGLTRYGKEGANLGQSDRFGQKETATVITAMPFVKKESKFLSSEH